MIVVFDSNIWQSDLYKRSNASAAVRFFLRQGGTKIAIPEVVQMEVENNLRLDLKKWIKSIEEAHRQMLGVFGTLKEVVLPTQDQIDVVVAEATTSLGVETLTV